MIIKIIVNARIPTEKAHGFQICKMCEEFSDLGNDVELIVPKRDNFINEDPFSYYGLKQNFNIRYVKKIVQTKVRKSFSSRLQSVLFFLSLIFLKIEKNSIIFTRNSEIVWLFKKRGFKVLFEAHGFPERKRKLYKMLTKESDLVVCNSFGTEEAHKQNRFEKTMVARNGVDLSKFDIQMSKEDAREEFGLPQRKKIIMYIGHLYKWKGVETVLEAAQLTQDREDVIFIFVGGTKEDTLKYKKVVQEKSLNNVLLLGHKAKDLIPRFLNAADVLLLPNAPISEESIKYTSPIKVFEYMASKRPILASDLSSIKEVLNEENAQFFKAGDAHDLKEKLFLLFNDEEKSCRIVERAFVCVKEYSWEKRAQKIINSIS